MVGDRPDIFGGTILGSIAIILGGPILLVSTAPHGDLVGADSMPDIIARGTILGMARHGAGEAAIGVEDTGAVDIGGITTIIQAT